MYNDDFQFAHMMTGNLYEYYHCYCGDYPSAMELCGSNLFKMYLFLAGDASYQMNGQIYSLRPNDILLISSDNAYCPAVSFSAPIYECIILWVNVDFFTHTSQSGTDLAACFKHALQNERSLFRPDSANLSRLLNACNSIEQEQTMDALGNKILIYSYVIEILTLLNRAYFEPGCLLCPNPLFDRWPQDNEITENELINQSLLYINSHIAESLTLDTIASHFYISKNYFSHLFKRHTGCSPYQYIMKKRLNLAYDMLCQGASVSDACETCGFNDYSNFLKAFRRTFGKNPSEVKNKDTRKP